MDNQAETIADIPQPDARGALAGKFKDMIERFTRDLEDLTEEELAGIVQVLESISGTPGAIRAYEASVQSCDGEWIDPSGYMGIPQENPWNKIPPGPVLRDLTRDFMPGAEYPTPEEIVEAESRAQGSGMLLFPGMPCLQNAFSGWGAAFNPGPEEAFTMGDSEERDQRQLEAVTSEADELRERINGDAQLRQAKIGAFKNVVAGGLHWLLEKLEGTPKPAPQPPLVQPRPTSNGHYGRAQVLQPFVDLPSSGEEF